MAGSNLANRGPSAESTNTNAGRDGVSGAAGAGSDTTQGYEAQGSRVGRAGVTGVKSNVDRQALADTTNAGRGGSGRGLASPHERGRRKVRATGA